MPMQVYLCMWLTVLGITIRNIYRIVEIGIGWAGYLNTHEVDPRLQSQHASRLDVMGAYALARSA